MPHVTESLVNRDPIFEREQNIHDNYRELIDGGFRKVTGLGWVTWEQYKGRFAQAVADGVDVPILTPQHWGAPEDWSDLECDERLAAAQQQGGN